jgi:hypothetical protein
MWDSIKARVKRDCMREDPNMRTRDVINKFVTRQVNRKREK